VAFPQVIDPSQIFTVSEITREIRQLLETQFPAVWLRGEISGINFHRSGHLYLTLKDAGAQISGVMWRSRVQRLEFRPADGQEALLYGRLVVYEKGGKYQFEIEAIQPSGQGALAAEFEKLKARLAGEGLFESDRKKPIPRFPRTIGVITSSSGAAIRDILVTLSRRAFDLDVLFVAAKVQGDGAASEIAGAINQLAQYSPAPEVIIVGRGGGSIEDLWAFNEEKTVRAITECPIPIISGVGHETDTTLADLAADLRAPTPTGAAELATSDRIELRSRIDHLKLRLSRSITGSLETFNLRLEKSAGAYGLKRLPDRLNQYIQQLDDLEARGKKSLATGLNNINDVIEKFESRLKALSPLGVLNRGYSIVIKDDKVVTDAGNLALDDYIKLVLAKGQAKAKISEIKAK